ncbi:MAG: DUF4430 domain-containing protein [bacterium]|nr:DUF4430 domain-containing protein [bacterium]
MNIRRIEIFVIIIIIAVIGVAFALTRTPSTEFADTDSPNEEYRAELEQQVQQVPSTSITYQGVEGRNALDLLKETHNIETQEFSGIGEFVNSIGGIEPDSSHFWGFYINGQQAQVGASQYETSSGDVIEWKLEKIGDY